MNIKEIKEMINLMNENGLIELEIERDGTKVKIRKASSGIPDQFNAGEMSFPSQV